MSSTLALIVLSCLSGVVITSDSPPDDAAWKTLRRQAVNRQRHVIFNNDGNEPVYFCKEATTEELLRSRTTPLAGSQVDAIFYCTWSSGFGMFTHNTRVGQVFNTREGVYQSNLTQEFLDRGIDPLRVMIDFAHAHRMELFWSFRVNDTHDASGAAYGPVMLRANRLKQEHPEWLIGTKEKRPRYGQWTAVNFGVTEIRDLAFRYCKEVCTGYGIDGIELDFYRHAFFFKCSGQGAPCGEEELSQMTDLLRRIRKMTEETGRRRGRPILLAVRVPDSVEYCRFIGLDLQRWLADGLVDLLIVGGYTQLNAWEYSVQLGHRYGAKVYPSLDEPRIRDETAQKLRASLASYRGRALNVWSSGADGVYVFNLFDPNNPLWRELGDPAGLRMLDRHYFASIRGMGAVPIPHQKFIRIPTLNPASPITVKPEKPAGVEFKVGEDTSAAAEHTRIELRLRFKKPPVSQSLHVRLNGQGLSAGVADKEWLDYALPGASLRQGANTLELSCRPEQMEPLSLLDLYVRITPP
ncbi:MAG: family 10 glycosylhydrolase [Phycisphaerae bacterium]|nr:family 10 glycosylhydrolase [Phycisphaerae bacterium]